MATNMTHDDKWKQLAAHEYEFKGNIYRIKWLYGKDEMNIELCTKSSSECEEGRVE